eukprot:TRINITY_DN25608_c0_g1_i1.p1 TRINITY_DN25608_c0_g1~~TRINITY_DN25608_c0_g1_i1.p1  ORF type:complete len:247 (+),score=74.78 TRINITY_DN25608_c0_g1_i1:351-1091(+)
MSSPGSPAGSPAAGAPRGYGDNAKRKASILRAEKRAKAAAAARRDKQAKEAAEVQVSDWGPVFVYGAMNRERAWANLINRVPPMRPALLRGYERRGVEGCPFAAAFINEDNEKAVTVGVIITTLLPWERRNLDAAVDDGFELLDVVVRPFDDPEGEDVPCMAYLWREDFVDALTEEDWDLEGFEKNWLESFCGFCKDTYEANRARRLPDDELKELALRRRRRNALDLDADDDDDDDVVDDEEEDQE